MYPSYVSEKCQGLVWARGKCAVAASVQLAESKDPQPAFWIRNPFWLCCSADQSHIKRHRKFILVFKHYAICRCHWGDFSTGSFIWHWLSKSWKCGLFKRIISLERVSYITVILFNLDVFVYIFLYDYRLFWLYNVHHESRTFLNTVLNLFVHFNPFPRSQTYLTCARPLTSQMSLQIFL